MAQLFVVPSKKKSSQSEKQNIKVVVRARPSSGQEGDTNAKAVIKYLSQKDILAKDKRFQYDRVFKPDASQIEVYQNVVASMMPDVLNGYNCTVFAYGQTGSGKTYTMIGSKVENVTDWKEDLHAGIIPRAASHIFNLLPFDDLGTSVKVSYLELYNEEIRDLLTDDETPLNIYDVKGSLFIQGLTEVSVNDSEGICRELQKGNIKRQTAPTLMNHQSSRSHTVFTVMVSTKERVSGEDVLKTGKINFVDLAGSENIARSGCKDIRAIELANINRSLLTLGRVIHALADKSKKHVPYRDSKLTRILQDSLGGHTKTCIVATISLAVASLDETLSTLEYACRARDIKNCPTVNEKLNPNQVIDSLFSTIKRLECDLEASRSGIGFYINKESYDLLIEEVKTLRVDKLIYSEALKERDKHIKELEHKMCEKTREYEDTVEVCRKSEEVVRELQKHIAQKKIDLQQERFLAKTYEQQVSDLTKDTQDLIKTSERLSEETNMLQRKVENQYQINKTNEVNANVAVRKMLDMLNELSEERLLIKDVDHNLCRLCTEDLAEFKAALQIPLTKLKNGIDNFDEALIKNVPIRESFSSELKNFVTVVKTEIFEIKTKFRECFDGRRIAHECASEFPKHIHGIIKRFQNSVCDVVRNVLDLFKKEDQGTLDYIEGVEKNILMEKQELDIIYKTRSEEDERLLKIISQLKQILLKRLENRAESFITQLAEMVNESENQVNGVTKNFIDAFKYSETSVPPYEKLDKMLSDTEQFSVELEYAGYRLETMHGLNTDKELDSLNKSITKHLEEVFKSVNANYDSIDCQLNSLLKGQIREEELFADLVHNTNQILCEEFLKKIVVTEHEGDTPSRQSEVKRKPLDPFTPREVLLQRFSAASSSAASTSAASTSAAGTSAASTSTASTSAASTFAASTSAARKSTAGGEEDKENLPETLNLSTSSYYSFRTASSLEGNYGDDPKTE